MADSFTVLDNDEIDDFYVLIKQNGFRKEDFELRQNREPMHGSELQIITGSVTVYSKVSKVEKTYVAGHGSSWPVQFRDDLSRGVFGKHTV